jgi:hypothetical protein
MPEIRPGQRVTFRLWDSPRAPRISGTVENVVGDLVEIKPDTAISSRARLGVHRGLIEREDVSAQSP